MVQRCAWVHDDSLEQQYHDTKWCRPKHDDQQLFMWLILEIMQAGLSWVTILHKQMAMQTAFDQFDYRLIAHYDENKIAELMQNAQIIRNRRKLTAMVNNAQVFLRVQQQFGSFDHYLWGLVDNQVQQNSWSTTTQVPAKSPLSERIAIQFKQLGFQFVGPTIIYSYLQAVGVINDHQQNCAFR
ncbi:DNA-3-methyladenine glycosylase I [Bombilactobacillus folatiphilus]|uniref:DNA-3-methyladenine glycosylase I n=1 Tax=Bombilactobacillus folatiphilus TaxID=2923362 RepID=A0ABY4P982_9LACO|nr:DNA-3-methyladenine glycosylase I [Bombilactobacillus folatiphilus]UQS82081.1 DNA-3-methyladenine glycosylase I [Bombilactobacillus folatiphilus]